MVPSFCRLDLPQPSFCSLGHIWNDMDLSSLYETTCTFYGNMIVYKIQHTTNITASGTKFLLRVTDYGNLNTTNVKVSVVN